MTTYRVPYDWVELEDTTLAREQLRQNFDSLAKSVGSIPTPVTAYDCLVDPTLAADNPGSKKFKTVSSAVSTMYGLGAPYTTLLRIGFVPNTTGTAAVDGSLPVNFPSTLMIDAVGSLAIDEKDGTGSGLCQWNLNGFQPGAATIFVRGIKIVQGNLSTFFGSGCQQFIGDRCYFDGGAYAGGSGAGVATLIAPMNNNTVHLHKCRLADSAAGAIATELDSCEVSANTAKTFNFGTNAAGSSLWMTDPVFFHQGPANPITVNFAGRSAILNPMIYAPGAQQSWTLALNGLVGQVLGAAGPYEGQTTTFSVTSSGARYVELEGTFNDVTLPAPTNGQSHRVHAHLMGALDITGPAQVSATVDGQGRSSPVTIRGNGVQADLAVQMQAGGTSVAITLDATAKGCVVGAAAYMNAVAATQKACAITAGASKNIVDVAGATTFPTASTDAGTGDLVRFA